MRAAEPFGGWVLPPGAVSTGNPASSDSDAAGKLTEVLVLDIADGHIQAVRAIANPDKLRHLEEASGTSP